MEVRHAIILVTSLLLASACDASSVDIHSDSKFVTVRGSTVIIDLKRDFPGELGIIGGNKIFYVIRDDEIDCSGLSVNGQIITIDTERLSGVVWDDGAPRTERVFSEAGAYEVVVAENLETEYDNADGDLVVVNYSRSDQARLTSELDCKISGP